MATGERATVATDACDPRFRPSDYTAALLQTLRGRRQRIEGADVLDMGCGSGAVLALLGSLGAASLTGIDIEAAAVAATRTLLDELGLTARASVHQGDLWQPVPDRRFDVIAANLPHFPMQPASVGERLCSWSCGGSDGRAVLDPFLEGLRRHLAPGGLAVLTHNAFVGLDRTRALTARHDMDLTVAATVLLPLPAARLARLTPAVREAELGRSILRLGPHGFAEVHIVEIGAP